MRVYVLTNDMMPGLSKIGMTRKGTAAKRAKSISSGTGVVGKWRVAGEWHTTHDPLPVEKAAHNHFAARRVTNAGGREIFNVPANEACAFFANHPQCTDNAVLAEAARKKAAEEQAIAQRNKDWNDRWIERLMIPVLLLLWVVATVAFTYALKGERLAVHSFDDLVVFFGPALACSFWIGLLGMPLMGVILRPVNWLLKKLIHETPPWEAQ